MSAKRQVGFRRREEHNPPLRHRARLDELDQDTQHNVSTEVGGAGEGKSFVTCVGEKKSPSRVKYSHRAIGIIRDTLQSHHHDLDPRKAVASRATLAPGLTLTE